MKPGSLLGALMSGMIGVFISPFAPTPAHGETIGSIQFEESYAGTHQSEFADLLAQAKIVVPGAVAYITGQWGLSNPTSAVRLSPSFHF